MTVNSTPARSTWRERAFVLAGLAIALAATAVRIAAGLPGEILGAIWIAAIAWTVAASLAAALRCVFVRGDRSAFHDCGRRHKWLPDSRAERFDWDTRSGRYTWMRYRGRLM